MMVEIVKPSSEVTCTRLWNSIEGTQTVLRQRVALATDSSSLEIVYVVVVVIIITHFNFCKGEEGKTCTEGLGHCIGGCLGF